MSDSDSINAAHQAVLEGLRAIICYLEEFHGGEDAAKWQQELSYHESYNADSRTDEQSNRLGNMLLGLPQKLMVFANEANKKEQWIPVRDLLVSWTAINDLAKNGTDYQHREYVQSHLKAVEAEIEIAKKNATPIPHDAPKGVN